MHTKKECTKAPKKKLIKAAHGFSVNRVVYNSRIDSNVKSLWIQLDSIRSNSIGKQKPRSSHKSGFCEPRLFHKSDVYTTIHKQQRHT